MTYLGRHALKGLLLLVPILSCAFALIVYLFDGSLWSILAAFFIAGPVVIVLLGILLARRVNDTGDDKQSFDRRG